MIDLINKYGDWAIVTGASSGIGKSFAYYLAGKGVNVILVARRKNLLMELKHELVEKYGVDAVIIDADLSERSGVEKVITECRDIHVGILVNNAGFGKTGSFASNNPDLIEDMINVNCLTPAMLTNYFTKAMIARRKGAVIFLGSIVAEMPVPLMSLYSATKSFDLVLGKCLWYELSKYNIDVITVNPGSTETEFDGLGSKKKTKFIRQPENVVETTFAALGGKQAVTDGIINKIMILISKIVGSEITVKLSGKYSEKSVNTDT